MGRVLVVDDEPHMHKILASSLGQDKHIISHAAGVEAARELIRSQQFEVILTDQSMPDGTGLQVLAAAHEADPDVSVIVLSALSSTDLAVESIRGGAYDFLAKPCTPEVLRSAVQRAFDQTTLIRENSLLKAEVERLEGPAEILGNTPAMLQLREKIARAARTSAAVLITGEPGTGKELVARVIHRQSHRSSKVFLSANCVAFPGASLESELFGHEDPRLPAERGRRGLCEAAHEGTLFLDEVAEMSPAVQIKLLHLLTDGQVIPVGSAKPRTVDVRVLAATQQDLARRVKEDQFREDLFHKLAAVPIAIPPLREHAEDIEALCGWFLTKIARERGLPERQLSENALRHLRSYEFPGNVRELRHLIERAVILSPGEEIGAEHLPLRASAGPAAEPPGNGERAMSLAWIEGLPPSFDLRNLLSTVEKTLIERTLQSTRGAQAEAARRLGLSRSDLSYKLLKYELRKETSAAS